MGCVKLDGARIQAVLLSPEILYCRGQKDSLWETRGESRRFLCAARQQSYGRYGECIGHHRGLRTGHVFMGITRELGRANSLLVGNHPEDEEYRNTKRPGVDEAAPADISEPR